MELKAGDIVAVTTPTTVGKLIRYFTRSPGEPPSKVGHVGLLVRGSPYPVIVEALSKGVMRGFLGAYKGRVLAIYRPLNLSDSDLSTIVAHSYRYVGKTYGYLKILAHMADWAFGGRVIFRRLARVDSWPICSYVVAKSYSVVGANFGLLPEAASPDDVADFCESNPDKYEVIHPLGPLT
jgi:hypothetical protein